MAVRKAAPGAVTGLAACIVFCSQVCAQEYGEFSKLTLRISTSTPEVLPLEPVQFTVALSNETDKVVMGHTCITPGGPYLHIYVAYDDGPFEEFKSSGSWPLSFVIARDLPLGAGLSKVCSGYLNYANVGVREKQGRYLFEEAGVCRIKVALCSADRKKVIESNVLAITAHSPEGEDAGAYGFLRKLTEAGRDGASYGGLLTGTFGKNVMGSRYKKVVEKQRELLSRFPNSRYARYVEYSLGLTYRNQEDEELFLRGIGLLERAASYEDFFLAEKALEELYRTFRNRGEPDKARQYQKRIAELAPDSGIGRDYLEQEYIARRREGNRAKGESAGPVEDVIDEQSDPGFRWDVGFGIIAIAVVGVGFALFLRKKLI